MTYYSDVSILNFEQVNTEWNFTGSFKKPEFWKNLEKLPAWTFKRISRACNIFNGDHYIVTKLKQLVTQTTKRKFSYDWFRWMILIFDTQLRHALQSYTNRSFSYSSFSCLPMKVCVPKVYAKEIVQLWDMHSACLFLEQFESWYACTQQTLSKFSESKNSI